MQKRRARCGTARRTNIRQALRPFLRLEWYQSSTGISWLDAKAALIRDAVRYYLALPSIRHPTA
ncbi:MAG: hypothetical protein U0840_31435 [Gemmataceae bacterium]